jgi:hypothetical protein
LAPIVIVAVLLAGVRHAHLERLGRMKISMLVAG